jgi:hypothetical protein
MALGASGDEFKSLNANPRLRENPGIIEDLVRRMGMHPFQKAIPLVRRLVIANLPVWKPRHIVVS